MTGAAVHHGLRLPVQLTTFIGRQAEIAAVGALLPSTRLLTLTGTRVQVGAALWPGASAAQVRSSFHVAAYHLRRVLGGNDRLLFEGGRYRLNPRMRIDFDAATFEGEIRAALRGRGEGGLPVRRLEDALALWRGEFLDGLSAGSWHEGPRHRLHHLYVDALLALADHHFDAGRLEDASCVYERVIACDAFDEQAHRRLMMCRARLGDRADAMRIHQRLARVLRDELRIEPEPGTTALFERLSRGDPI